MTYGGLFDIGKLESELNFLKEEMNADDFWMDLERAGIVNRKYAKISKLITDINNIKTSINDNLELLEILNEDEIKDIFNSIDAITKDLDELEIENLLNGEFDDLNCYLEIHPGAGGTESCDWAAMLLRMYKMFCEKNGFSYEVVEEQKGDEAGIKSATIKINGPFAYGYLKNEKGVHRLVRISPFDAGKRRHTSFASVGVIPEYNKDISIDIKETDLKIDVYHSSGAGGQSVNTANSAVRITHLPTKTVVTCQQERSQLKNKEMAMKLLKSKLFQLEQEKKQKELATLKGENTNIDFGSQIRNYVLEPYKLIKDTRVNYETSNVDKFLDGDFLPLLEALVRNKK
mgnify:FL=1